MRIDSVRGDMMKHQTMPAITPAASVLSMEPEDIAAFIRGCVQERSLSTLVCELNNDLLFGSSDQRTDARRALVRLGFMA